MTFLKLYEKWMEAGQLPSHGLCLSVPAKLESILNELEPIDDDCLQLTDQGYSIIYWGSDVPKRSKGYELSKEQFTPLRQTIILLCAALNGEFDN